MVEGLVHVDDPDDVFEAADVAEYFGGQDFASAARVVVSQLKHSTRSPDKAWTAARLCSVKQRRSSVTGEPTGPGRAVLRDLASVYKGLAATHGRENVLRTLRIRLVSNQPAAPELTESLRVAVELATAEGGPVGAGALLKALPAAARDVIMLLRENLKNDLTSQGFCDFLTILDLSECGQQGRLGLELGVRGEVSALTPGAAGPSALALFDLVRRHALPDMADRTGLRRQDVLAALGVGSTMDLYPAPALLPDVRDQLPAPSADDVVMAILAASGGTVVVHGPAGAGKTVTMTQVGERLPSGSVVVLYDCFGSGNYLHTGEDRHTSRRFVTQVVNELAQLCGTPLLLQPPSTEEDLWRRFTTTLHQAVERVPEPGRVVLVVDAADNAAFAAERKKERGFLAGLRDVVLPARVTVVVTARSHRLSQLGVDSAASVHLKPFTPPLSAIHLRRHVPDATDEETARFHELTAGNPRSQFYVLDRAAHEAWDLPTLLDACRPTPEALFEDLVNSAVHVTGTDAGGSRWLALMAALSRPVRMEALAEVLSVSQSQVAAFAEGLSPGVTVEAGTIAFRDEDFEKYVMDVLTADDLKQAHSRLADLFLETRTTDSDAAIHVADHLFDAGRASEVVELVLAESTPIGIPDGFQRLDVRNRRLDLAMKAAVENGDASQAVRLVMRAAAAASTKSTLATLIRTEPDLAARYSDPRTLAYYHVHETREQWLAPAHMRAAAVLARDPGTRPQARQHLADTEAWLRRAKNAPRTETVGWDLEPADLAAAAEAHYLIAGPAAAIAWFARWRPTSFVSDAVAEFAAKLAPTLDPRQLQHDLAEMNVPPRWHAPFIAYLHLRHQLVDPEWINSAIHGCLAAPAGEPALWKDLFTQAAVQHGDRVLARRLLEHWIREVPDDPWAFSQPHGPGAMALLQQALIAILDGTAEPDIHALLPESLQPSEQRSADTDRVSRNREKWLRRAEPLLEMCTLRARILTSAGPVELAAAVDRRLPGLRESASHRWFRGEGTYRAWAVIATEAVLDSATDLSLLDDLADLAPAVLRDQAPKLWLDMAAALTARCLEPARAVDLCERAAAHAQEQQYSASDRLELLTACAKHAAEVSPQLGEVLFVRATDVASGIDDDAARLLSVHARLASRGAAAVTGERAAPLAKHLVHAAAMAARHVTDRDVVPFADVLAAAGRLNPAIAFTTASRWDDEDLFVLDGAVPALMVSAVEHGLLTVQDALCLRHLIPGPSQSVETSLKLLEALPADAQRVSQVRRETRRVAHWIRASVPADAQPRLARRVVDWAEQHAPADKELHTVLDPVLAFEKTEISQSRVWSPPDEGDDQATPVLTQASSRTWKDLPQDTAVLQNSRVSRDAVETFIMNVAKRTAPEERLQALDTVAALPSTRAADAWTSLRVLAALIRSWQNWPGVRAWAADKFPQFLTRHVADLVFYTSSSELLITLRTFGLPDAALRRALLAGFHERRPELSVYQSHALALILADLTAEPEAADAVMRELQDLHPAPEPRPETELPDSAAAVMAGFLWSAFGHYRKSVRWQAAHAARALLLNSQGSLAAPLADRLVACLSSTTAGAFRSRDLVFYWLSARVWLLAVFQRVSAEQPAILARHLPTLIGVATSRALPHAQIRELARTVALTVAEAVPGADITELAWANRPAACSVNRGWRDIGDENRNRPDGRYHFDVIDTMPYWFAPLARVFGVQLSDIATRAERWIVDEWQLGEDDWMKDARELRDERTAGRMMHRHGSIPPEESLHLYLEYHAMMLAAGEILDAGTPVHVDDHYDDVRDPWQDWLSGHLPGSAHVWLADLRGQIPADPMLFGHVPPIEEWHHTVPSDFDVLLGIEDGELPERVCVAAYAHITRPGGYGHMAVMSALVSAVHAPALQRALQASGNPMDWKLPMLQEDEFEVDHGAFQLRGWLTENQLEREGLDGLDQSARGLVWGRPLPGSPFRAWARCEPNLAGTALAGQLDRKPAWTESWSDEETDERGYTHRVSSSGYRTYVNRADLSGFLTHVGMELILEVQIGRQQDRGTRSGEYRTPRCRIYLIDGTGRVATL